MIMVDDDGRGWCSFTIRRRRQHRTTSNFMHHTHHHIQFSHNSRSNGPTSPQQNQNIEKIQMLPRLQRSQSMLLGQPDSKVLARLFGPWCFTKRKKIIQRCLSGSAVDLFWSQLLQKTVNCSLSEIWLQCSYSTLFKDFCNNTSILLQQHFSISATSFCSRFHPHLGSTELL